MSEAASVISAVTGATGLSGQQSTSQSSSGTRGSRTQGGQGRGGRTNRDRNRASRGSVGGNSGARSAGGATFKGNTDEMKGNVFQCHGETTDKQQFIKTIGVLEEHVNKSFSYPQDVASLCKAPFDLRAILQPANISPEVFQRRLPHGDAHDIKRQPSRRSHACCAGFKFDSNSIQKHNPDVLSTFWFAHTPCMYRKCQNPLFIFSRVCALKRAQKRVG